MPETSRTDWVIELLAASHDRSSFSCGKPSLDTYLQRFARQNDRLGIGRTFVAVAPGDTRVVGYYTVSNGSVTFETIPEEVRKKLPRYPIPVLHLGRLAVDKSVQGKGLGETLLMDALHRAASLSEDVGLYAVEVHALDHEARRFYERYGFSRLVDDELHLYLPMKLVRKLF